MAHFFKIGQRRFSQNCVKLFTRIEDDPEERLKGLFKTGKVCLVIIVDAKNRNQSHSEGEDGYLKVEIEFR